MLSQVEASGKTWRGCDYVCRAHGVLTRDAPYRMPAGYIHTRTRMHKALHPKPYTLNMTLNTPAVLNWTIRTTCKARHLVTMAQRTKLYTSRSFGTQPYPNPLEPYTSPSRFEPTFSGFRAEDPLERSSMQQLVYRARKSHTNLKPQTQNPNKPTLGLRV